MIVTEHVGDRIHIYSDAGMKILQNQTGIVYEDAMDVPGIGYTYTETDEPVTLEPVTAEEALDILLGEASE